MGHEEVDVQRRAAPALERAQLEPRPQPQRAQAQRVAVHCEARDQLGGEPAEPERQAQPAVDRATHQRRRDHRVGHQAEETRRRAGRQPCRGRRADRRAHRASPVGRVGAGRRRLRLGLGLGLGRAYTQP